jgi:cytochrome c biogenesis protein CcmG/thiol:disulfide interchange protein DsbE
MSDAPREMDQDGNVAGEAPRSGARPILVIIPLIIFVAIAALFALQLYSGDPTKLPSVLIDKKVPQFDLKALAGLERDGQAVPGFSSDDLATGEVTVVNVWASWCVPCRLEHPYVAELARQPGARVYGLNYKDKTENALKFLSQLGNPFAAVGVDDSGRVAIDWGVYGVPETFIVDGGGTIRYKHVGPINPDVLIKLREIIDGLNGKPAGGRG